MPSNESLPVPAINDESAIARAQLEERTQYPSENLVARGLAELELRKKEIELRRFELDNRRLEKEIDLENTRETNEMTTRHQLAKFLIYAVCPGWALSLLGIVVATGIKVLTLSDTVLLAIIAANPLGIGALLLIVTQYFFPKKTAPNAKT